jgi:hypothetical protein
MTMTNLPPARLIPWILVLGSIGFGLGCKSSAPSAKPATDESAPASTSSATTAPHAPAAADQTRAPEAQATGYDLYSWRGPGTWFFSLLPGINRLRSTEEVKAQSTTIDGISALKTRLRQLERGSKVSWSQNVPGTELPTTEIVSDMSAFTAQHGIDLSVKQ